MATIEQRLRFLKNQDDYEDTYAALNNLHNIFFMAPTRNNDGYGTTSFNMRRRAPKHGYFFSIKQNKQKIGLCYHLPNTLSLVNTPVKISYTMFESTQYPRFWEPYLKQANHVIVPTQFCADIMKKNFGVEPEVIPLGYDPDFFYHIDRTRNDDHKFTFLHYDAFKWRKGWDIAFTAFNLEFGETGGDDVRLVFKTTLQHTPPLQEYPKVKIIKGIFPQDEMMSVLKDADCFIFPTRGEGFGLTPLEAMATGMPAIVPNHSGMSHYFHNEYCMNVECEEVKARYDNIELRQLELGTYWQPTVESTRKAMRSMYESWKRDRAAWDARSKLIADYAKGYSIEETTKKVCKVLDRFL